MHRKFQASLIFFRFLSHEDTIMPQHAFLRCQMEKMGVPFWKFLRLSFCNLNRESHFADVHWFPSPHYLRMKSYFDRLTTPAVYRKKNNGFSICEEPTKGKAWLILHFSYLKSFQSIVNRRKTTILTCSNNRVYAIQII